MKFSKIGVVGAGTLGQGIAEMLAGKGLAVYITESTPLKLEQAFRSIEISLDRQIEKWAITAAEKQLILKKLNQTEKLEQLADCELVIETVTEDLETKKNIFIALDRICAKDTILASNTSTLSLTELASVTVHPERVIGMHFLHPVGKINLVEIVRGLKTTEETYLIIREFVEETIDKMAIQVYESPGYVTTRLINTLINEAIHTLTEGVATAEHIDAAMRIGYDFHYGPLEMADRFGLDAVYTAMERMFREFGDTKYRPNYLLKQMVRGGQLGVKTGQGFFRYGEDGERL